MTPEWLREELEDDPRAWYDYAACLGLDLFADFKDLDEVLFPLNPKTRDDDAINAFVYDYCDACPVKNQCIDFAAKTESLGIWGGLDLSPRKASRLGRLRRAEGTVTVESAKEALGENDDSV